MAQKAYVPDIRYGVVLKSPCEHRLLCSLKRSAAGDAYFFLPSQYPKANRHVSYHKSGQRHLKSYKWTRFVSRLQRPDQAFRGAEALFAMAIPPGQAHHYPVLSPTARFDARFEIDHTQILETEHHTLTADLVEPGRDALRGPWNTVVAQKTLDDAVPWIVVSLWRGLSL